MKAIRLLAVVFALALPMAVSAQSASTPHYQFGFVSYQRILEAMPEYGQAKAALQDLRKKYDDEAKYNEVKLNKMYADYLQGQKKFPEQIMLKRQKELQIAMEQGISFRQDAERLLSNAERELLKPVRHKLDSILSRIGRENGLLFIGNTDDNSFPFVHSQIGKDITEIVIARLNGKIIPINRSTPEQESSAASREARPQASEPAVSTPTANAKP